MPSILVCVLVVTEVTSDMETAVGGGNVVKGGGRGSSVDEDENVDFEEDDVEEYDEGIVVFVKRGING